MKIISTYTYFDTNDKGESLFKPWSKKISIEIQYDKEKYSLQKYNGGMSFAYNTSPYYLIYLKND